MAAERIFGSGATRWRNLTNAALGDGMTGAALLARYEGFLRPEPLRWADWSRGQLEKVADGLGRIETMAGEFGSRLDIGTVTFACGLSYVDFRFPDLGWRQAHPRTAAWYDSFSARPSMQATQLVG